MAYDYYSGQMPYTVDNITFIMGSRQKGRVVSFEDGRKNNALVYVYSGELEYTFEDSRLILKSGDCLFSPTGDKFLFKYLKDSKIGTLTFNVKSGSLPSPFSMRFTECEGLTVAEWEKISRECQTDTVLYAARIYDIIRIIAEKKRVIPKKYQRLLPAIREMSADYITSRPIGYYAQLCGISEPTFRRNFTEYLGASPIEHRNKLRLQNAERMISSGEYSVEEAALSVGFTNLSFFYRSYKKLFGHKPG